MATATLTRRFSEQTTARLLALPLAPLSAVAGWQIGRFLWFSVILGG